MDIDFEDLELTRGNHRVVWEWIGEGNGGDYNEDDPTDVPLLRFSCYTYLPACGETAGAGTWEQSADASYCTRLPVTTPIQILARAAAIILEALDEPSPKRRLEELSWFCIEDFRKER